MRLLSGDRVALKIRVVRLKGKNVMSHSIIEQTLNQLDNNTAVNN